MTDDGRRAVSTTLGYVLMLSVASLLVVGLLTAGSGFVSDQRERVVRAELEVVGQQVASDVMAADRLVRASDGSSTTVRITDSRPNDVTGSPYRVTLVDDGDPHLELETAKPAVQVTVQLSTTTAVRESSVNGGDVVVRYDASGELVIENA